MKEGNSSCALRSRLGPGAYCTCYVAKPHPHPRLHFNSPPAPVIPLPYCFPTAMPALSASVIIHNATIKLYVTCTRPFLLPALNLPGTQITSRVVSAHFIIIYKAYISDFDSPNPPLKLAPPCEDSSTQQYLTPAGSPLPSSHELSIVPLLCLRLSLLSFLTSFSFSCFRTDLSQKQSPNPC